SASFGPSAKGHHTRSSSIRTTTCVPSRGELFHVGVARLGKCSSLRMPHPRAAWRTRAPRRHARGPRRRRLLLGAEVTQLLGERGGAAAPPRPSPPPRRTS